jgi:LysM repeat protein
MRGIINALRDGYIRFLVWLGAEPPSGYEYLIGEEAGPRQYTLKQGDTIFAVARRFGVHYDLIARANNLEDPSQAKTGLTLIIPAADWVPPPELPSPTPAVAPLPEPAPQEAPVERPLEEVAPPILVEEEPEWLTVPEVQEGPAVEEALPDEDIEWLLAEGIPAVKTPVAPPSEAVEEAPAPVETIEAPPEEEVVVAPPPVAEPEMVFRYEVQRGDTLSGVARKYGVTVKELVDANHLTDSSLFPGQKLIIPGYMEPKPALPPEAPPITRPLPEAEEEQFVYTIASGDTLNGIAKRYGITVRELIEANHIENPNLLRVGQKLIIPGVITPVRPMEPARIEVALPPRPFVLGTNPTFPPLGPKEAVRGLYVSYFAIGHNETWEQVLELLETTELNTVVIDAKGDFGLTSYSTQIPLAREIGAVRPTIKDFGELLHQLKSRGIYTIARIVTFKDNPLARSYPELAVKTSGGAIWQDSEKLGWADPFLTPVWEYNIQIAVETAQLGVDEVQFDAVRFPTPSASGAPHFSQEATRESRVTAITGFLSIARGQLEPLGVKIAANVSGYTCWRQDDSVIGQDLERMGQYLDVLCPVLWPSTFNNGIPDYKMAVAHPYEVVYHSAKQAIDRLKPTACAVRPWLQDFPDYRFDKRVYGKDEIQAQIKGCFDAGCVGFMVWDPQVDYTREAYAPATLHQPVAN